MEPSAPLMTQLLRAASSKQPLGFFFNGFLALPFFTRFCVVLLSDACACRLGRRIAVGADAAGGDSTGLTARRRAFVKACSKQPLGCFFNGFSLALFYPLLCCVAL